MPPPDSPAAFDPDLPPSSSLLFYLFADRVAPAARRGTRALLADVRVDTERLAGALFGVAFWQLRAAGLIRLEPVNQGQFVRTGTQLRVVRTSGVESGRRDGI